MKWEKEVGEVGGRRVGKGKGERIWGNRKRKEINERKERWEVGRKKEEKSEKK